MFTASRCCGRSWLTRWAQSSFWVPSWLCLLLSSLCGLALKGAPSVGGGGYLVQLFFFLNIPKKQNSWHSELVFGVRLQQPCGTKPAP